MRRLLALVLLLAACSRAEPPAGEPLVTLTGIWTVTGYQLPGVGAMNDSIAGGFVGQSLRLGAGLARWDSVSCARPDYRGAMVDGDSLRRAFRLRPGAIPALDTMTTVPVLRLQCPGEPWTGVGVMLIGLDADHALAPWDGTFFELTRDHDFRAGGDDPAWSLAISRGVAMTMTVNRVAARVTTPVPAETALPGSDARMLHAITETHDLRVMITPARCTTATGTDTLPNAVSVTLDGTTYQGCGSPIE